MRRTICAVLCATLLSGCYQYRNVPMDQTREGMRVRAIVTQDAAVELGGALGPGVASVEGNVVGSDTAGLTLSIRMVRLQGGTEQYWRGENYTLPRRLIAVLEHRQVDRLRTGVAAVGMAALWAGLFAAARGGGGGDRPTRPAPPQQ